MSLTQESEKPQTVVYATWALWAWTAWICLFGIYQSWMSIPEIERTMTEQLQGMFTVAPSALKEIIIGGYGLLAVMSAWIVLKIAAGKNWARSSLLWGFALEVICAVVPPYHGFLSYLTDIPDYGFQGYALYMLYTKPGCDWFQRR